MNAARAVKAMKCEVIASGIIGGHTGRCLLEALDGEDIRHSFTTIKGETRCCINIIDLDTGLQTEYLEPGPSVSTGEYEVFLELYDHICSQAEAVTISGSLPPGIPENAYEELIRRTDRKVFLDTSGIPLKKALKAAPFCVKPNRTELAELAGVPMDSQRACMDALASIHEMGITRALVSLGSDGAMMCCSEGTFQAVPPAIEAINSVGCGDAMTAALAVAEIRKLPPHEALKLAVAVSAAAAGTVHTGEMDIVNAESILNKVKLEKLC